MSNKPFPSREEILAIRKQYDAETIIELIDMQDEWSNLRPGDIGTVQYVDDAGQIQMRWRQGSRLALIPGVDLFKIIGREEQHLTSISNSAFGRFSTRDNPTFGISPYAFAK